jgi:hypothetical protein
MSGTRRIKGDLEDRYGVIVSRRAISRVMRELGLKARATRKYKVYKKSHIHLQQEELKPLQS